MASNYDTGQNTSSMVRSEPKSVDECKLRELECFMDLQGISLNLHKRYFNLYTILAHSVRRLNVQREQIDLQIALFGNLKDLCEEEKRKIQRAVKSGASEEEVYLLKTIHKEKLDNVKAAYEKLLKLKEEEEKFVSDMIKTREEVREVEKMMKSAEDQLNNSK